MRGRPPHARAGDRPHAVQGDDAGLKFSAGATSVEHIYDPNRSYGADDDSSHRLMTVVPEGVELTFHVDCPTSAIFRTCRRGYSVRGDELWLFHPSLIEIYTRR